MVHFKEYKRRDKVYLSIVQNEDTKAVFGTTFIVYPSLLCPDVEKIPIIPYSDFVSLLTTRVADRAHVISTFSIMPIITIIALLPLFHYLGEESSLVKFVGAQH